MTTLSSAKTKHLPGFLNCRHFDAVCFYGAHSFSRGNHASDLKHAQSFCRCVGSFHSRPQRPRSFWSAPRIATSGLVQRHSVFEWLCKHNRLRSEPIRFVKLHSEHAQSDGKSVNRGLPGLDLARGRDSWC